MKKNFEIEKNFWDWKKYLNVKFSKGHLTPPKPKSEDIEKSIGRIKKW